MRSLGFSIGRRCWSGGFLRRCGLALVLLAWTTAAESAAILIWPVQPVISGGERATALWLENRGREPVVMQLRIFAWIQEPNDDQYHAQEAVVGSPPMMRIAPGNRQMIRLIRQQPTPPGTEQAWRVLIDEIPVRRADPETGPPQAGIRFQMRYSLPLFTYGPGVDPPQRRASADLEGTAYPQLHWRVVRQNGQEWLEFENRGARHARLSRVAFVREAQRQEVSEGLLGYVLGGSIRRWPLPEGVRPEGTLVAHIGGIERAIAAAGH